MATQTKFDYDTEDFQATSIGMAKLTSPVVFIFNGEIEGIETKFSERADDGTMSKLMYAAYGKLDADLDYMGKKILKGTAVQLLFNSTALFKIFTEFGQNLKGVPVRITGRGVGVDRRYHVVDA